MAAERLSGEVVKYLVADLGSTQVYREDFKSAILQACEEQGIEDLKKEGQRPWKAVCRRVGEILFPDNDVLRDHRLYANNSKAVEYSTNNRFDYILLNAICDEYIYWSDIYNKLCSTVAYSYVVNIPTTTIDLWRGTEPSSESFKIWQKLQGNRKDCIKDKAYDSNSPVGSMFVGNNEFGMNQPGIGVEATQRIAQKAEDLPKLDTKNSFELTDNSPDRPPDIG